VKRVLPVLAPILLIGIALGIGWYVKLISFGHAQAEPMVPGTIPYALPERVVNLADRSGFRYLKIQITLEFVDPNHRPGELSGDALTQQETTLSQGLAPYDPAVEDFLITTLTSQTASDLLTTEGKDALRKELLDGLRRRIPAPTLQAVYFTEFVIQ
jgi:flagellar basal body-associated protein FliL